MTHQWKNSAYQAAWEDVEAAYAAVRELRQGDSVDVDNRLGRILDNLEDAEYALESLDED